MEDEEYIPENTDLRFYLESLNLYDGEKESGNFSQVADYPHPNVGKEKAKINVEYIDKDVVELIEELLAARMLFEEDVANVENLLSNFKVDNTGMLRSIFENVSGFVVIVLGLCVYWLIGSYVFFIVSIYYAYHAADYLWRKHYNQKRLRHLVQVLKSNYTLFTKTLKFINDSDKILKSGVRSKCESTKVASECELYFNLKKEFSQAEAEIIGILTRATKKLINKLPFYDFVENPKYYLCNRFDQHFLECIDLSKLYQVYLLVQSEFLQRLALSLIPNIKACGKENCCELYKIMKETSLHLKRLEEKLSQKFKYVYLRGIYHNNGNKISLNLKKRVKTDSKSRYKHEFISSIQDVSNSFQRLLIQSRGIEENFTDEQLGSGIEMQLTDIQNELNMCQRNISDSIIVLKKFSNDKTSIKDVPDSGEHCLNENETQVEGCPIDLNEEDMVEDEIFEAHLTSDTTQEAENDYDFEDIARKKIEREYSNMVLQELKCKIAEKAKIMKVREENARRRKIGGKDDDVESHVAGDVDGNSSDGDDEVDESVEHDGFHVRNVSSERNMNKNRTDSTSSNEGCKTIPTFQVPNSQFMADVFMARERLLKKPMGEEYFCDSENETDE